MDLLDDPRYRSAAKRVNEQFASVNRAEVIPLLELCRELAHDAERYRWLRKYGKAADIAAILITDDGDEWLEEGDLDAAIDAAMNGANT